MSPARKTTMLIVLLGMAGRAKDDEGHQSWTGSGSVLQPRTVDMWSILSVNSPSVRAAHVSGEVPRGDTNPEDFVVDVDDDGIHDPDRQLRDEHVRATLVGKSVGGLVKVLLVQMYWKASAILSTTHVGAGPMVRKFTNIANEYFLDEAGSAKVAETLQLRRVDCRIDLAGDPKQLVPETLSAGTRYNTPMEPHSVNPLAPQHMMLALFYDMGVLGVGVLGMCKCACWACKLAVSKRVMYRYHSIFFVGVNIRKYRTPSIMIACISMGA